MEHKEYQGKATSAKVFTALLEETAETQIREFLDHPAFDGLKVRIMPDVHAGAGAVIGFTSTLGDKIIPNVIGVDIGCGVITARMAGPDAEPDDLARFDEALRRVVPSGFSVHERQVDACSLKWQFDMLDRRPRWATFDNFASDVREVCDRLNLDHGRVWRSIGTLGGGNHFVEIDRSVGTGDLWLTVHSGSRNFGLQIANYHQKIAISQCGKMGGLEYLTGDDALQYMADMQTAQLYALLNRRVMMNVLFEAATFNNIPCVEDVPSDCMVESTHNFIDFEDRVIRKGAIRAHTDELMVIPWNMRDGIIIGRGLGNEDWNQSAPHGAGRRMGRQEAKRRLSVDTFAEQMRASGVWSSCVGRDTLDEAPDAYKPSTEIEASLGETVEVIDRLLPIYNFKASESRK